MAQLNKQLVTNITFNDTFDCFVCCHEKYIRIFNISPLREIAEIDTSRFGTVFLCDVLSRSNILGFVTHEGRNVFQIYNDAPDKKSIKMRLKFMEDIFGILIRRQWMAIILRSEIHVYRLHWKDGVFNKPTVVQMYKTYDNQRGICDITRCEQSYYQLLISPSTVKGSVQISNLKRASRLNETERIPAHNHEIGPIALSKSADLFVTSSVQGTLLRIWNSITKHKLFEFRRGADQANIYSLNFDDASMYICCTSDKGTLHAFSIIKSTLPITDPLKLLQSLIDDRSVSTYKTYTTCKVICAFVSRDMVVALGFNGTFRRYQFNFVPDGSSALTLNEYEEFLQLCVDSM